MEMLVLPRMEMRDMDARTEERLKELIMEAASLVPTEGGRLLLEEGPEDSCLWGDRIGFIRLGLGLATGAFRPSTYIRGATNAVDTGVDHLIDLPPRGDFQFCWADDWNAIEKRARAKYSSLPAAIAGGGIGITGLIVAAAIDPYCESTRCITWLAIGVIFALAFLGGGGLAFYHWLREE
jgi:hypothetical protein